MRQNRPFRRLGVGSVIAASVGALGLLGFNTLRPASDYVLLADNAAGLSVGDPVIEQGVTVGMVRAIHISDGQPRIRFRFNDRDRVLRSDATVRVHRPLLSAHPVIRILPGCTDVPAHPRELPIAEASYAKEVLLRTKCRWGPALESLGERVEPVIDAAREAGGAAIDRAVDRAAEEARRVPR